MYYVCDTSEGSTDKFDNLTDAMNCGESLIEDKRDDAGDYGWGDMSICIYQTEYDTDEPEDDGILVASAQECDRVNKPEDLDEDGYSESTQEYWNEDFDYICNYKMVLTADAPAARAD